MWYLKKISEQGSRIFWNELEHSVCWSDLVLNWQ